MLKGQSIGVLGGGVAGLSFAICAADRGARVTVFEQAQHPGEAGAGLQLSRNGTRVLDAMGIDARQALHPNVPGKVRIHDMSTGRQLMRQVQNRPGHAGYLQAHRADLIATLVTAAQMRDITFRPSTPAAINGLKIAGQSFDRVVRASGIRGRAAHFTGQVAWRALVPGQGETTDTRIFIAPGCHLVVYPLRGGQVINLVGVQNGQTWDAEVRDHVGDPDAFRAAFSQTCADLQGLLDRVENVRCRALCAHTDVSMIGPDGVPSVGDAAQAMLPFVAQGAVMALEDAWSLAAALDGTCSEPDWANRRAGRRAAVMRTALANGHVLHEARPWFLPFHRLGMCGLDKLWPGFGAARLRWIYDYDVVMDFP
ncbi:MAG: NAD(P)-binding protein [Rhodobacteraceae bacterium]|nr:NAD(P)-binding protein [Paracoccaceae bacterium]